MLGIAGPGDLLGAMTAVRDTVRSATATAVLGVRVVVLSVARLRSFLSRHPEAVGPA